MVRDRDVDDRMRSSEKYRSLGLIRLKLRNQDIGQIIFMGIIFCKNADKAVVEICIELHLTVKPEIPRFPLISHSRTFSYCCTAAERKCFVLRKEGE